MQQIVLIDAPVVLGWREWRRIDSQYGLGLMKSGLEPLTEKGLIARQPVEPLAHLLVGAVNEAAMKIAASADPAAVRQAVGQSLDNLLHGLRASIRAPRMR